MSNDIINQITLNYLISKQQLEKLNKSKENPGNKHREKRDVYRDRLSMLFTDLLHGNKPDNLLMEVTRSFDYFIDNCIYYFEIHDNNMHIEKDRSNKNEENNNNNTNQHHKEENHDHDEEEPDEEEPDEEEPDEEEQETIVKYVITPNNMNVSLRENFVYPKKRNTSIKTEGVESLSQLPLDWFTKVQKKSKIISKKI